MPASTSESFFAASFLGARADRSILPQAAEEELDFGKGQAHLAREANQPDAVGSVRRATTLLNSGSCAGKRYTRERRSQKKNRRQLPAQARDEPEKEGERDAQNQAGDDGKVKSGVFAAVNDVPRKFSQAKGELVAEVQKSADKDEKGSQEKKGAAEIAERVHEVILPEVANPAFEQPWPSLEEPCPSPMPGDQPKRRIRSAPSRKRSS